MGRASAEFPASDVKEAREMLESLAFGFEGILAGDGMTTRYLTGLLKKAEGEMVKAETIPAHDSGRLVTLALQKEGTTVKYRWRVSRE